MITLIAGMVKNTFSAMSEKVITFPLTAFWMYIGVQPQKNGVYENWSNEK
jgi:hypothetical protein